ncbi:uncharacterized protein E0L32_001237 [Thyridium curvatum]|uniref:Uncharacterized protein n=1 Tax=Thyridium curvatum TaxID=1093900 RepID=A0A507B0J0_9PEZI|nr:uncharacterized protein E0L32_001237 [Thyridium curvatum]TPX10040.1 hypothetical protein E0L32_001237 [Thyridium curvatum]
MPIELNNIHVGSDPAPPPYSEAVKSSQPAATDTGAAPASQSTQNNARPGTSNPTPPPKRHRFRLSKRCPKLLSRLPLFLGLFFGIGTATACTYLLVRRVNHLVATAKVDGNPAKWSNQAVQEAYDPCYLGCRDGSCETDVTFAQRACARTGESHLGEACNGKHMWNWQERYPAHCLDAVGAIFRDKALADNKASKSRLMGLTVLILIGAFGVGWLIFHFLRRAIAKRHAARAAARSQRRTVSGRGKGRWRKWSAVLLAVFGRPAQSYPCTQHAPIERRNFANHNNTIRGAVYGALSDCEDSSDCHPDCRTKCHWSFIKFRTVCHWECEDVCVTGTRVTRDARSYVASVMQNVYNCGFREEWYLENGLLTRIANPGIESNHWVTISVDGFNVTSPNVTDPAVVCLYNIGGQ